MKPASCKQKGRSYQQWVRDELLKAFPVLEQDDIKSTSMGAQGVDVQLSPAAQKLFPFDIECKAVERINVWEAWKQASANAKKNDPILFIKRNRVRPLVVLDAEQFISIMAEINSGRGNVSNNRDGS